MCARLRATARKQASRATVMRMGGRKCCDGNEAPTPRGQGVAQSLGIQVGEIRHGIAGVLGEARFGGRRGRRQGERGNLELRHCAR